MIDPRELPKEARLAMLRPRTLLNSIELAKAREEGANMPIPEPVRPASAFSCSPPPVAAAPSVGSATLVTRRLEIEETATGPCPVLKITHDDHQTDHPRQAAKLERDPSDAPLAASQVQETAASRILVGIVSVRKRLLDEDNLCEKFHVDCLHYIGAIPADDPATVRIETTQRKAQKGEAEHTEITISYP